MSPAPWLVELERALAEDEGTEALATGLGEAILTRGMREAAE